MESRAFALWTGIFIIGLAAAMLAWANWLARDPVTRKPYRVVAGVPVTGLNPQAQVRYRGIAVGRVTAIGLDHQDPRRIVIDIEVDAGIPVTRGTYAQLGMEGITGIAYVHLLDDGRDATPARGVGGAPPEIALRPSFMDSVADGAEGAVRDARELMANANALLAPENRRRIANTLASLERVAANLDSTTARLPVLMQRAEAWLAEDQRRVVHESLEHVKEATQALPQVAAETQRLLQDTRATVGQFGRLSAQTGSALDALRVETVPKVDAAADSAERAAARVGGLAGELQRSPQSVLWGGPPARPGPGEPGFQ